MFDWNRHVDYLHISAHSHSNSFAMYCSSTPYTQSSENISKDRTHINIRFLQSRIELCYNKWITLHCSSLILKHINRDVVYFLIKNLKNKNLSNSLPCVTLRISQAAPSKSLKADPFIGICGSAQPHSEITWRW